MKVCLIDIENVGLPYIEENAIRDLESHIEEVEELVIVARERNNCEVFASLWLNKFKNPKLKGITILNGLVGTVVKDYADLIGINYIRDKFNPSETDLLIISKDTGLVSRLCNFKNVHYLKGNCGTMELSIVEYTPSNTKSQKKLQADPRLLNIKNNYKTFRLTRSQFENYANKSVISIPTVCTPSVFLTVAQKGNISRVKCKYLHNLPTRLLNILKKSQVTYLFGNSYKVVNEQLDFQVIVCGTQVLKYFTNDIDTVLNSSSEPLLNIHTSLMAVESGQSALSMKVEVEFTRKTIENIHYVQLSKGKLRPYLKITDDFSIELDCTSENVLTVSAKGMEFISKTIKF